MKYFRRASHKLKLTVRRPEDIIWCVYREISERVPEIPDYTDYEAITRITNTLKNKEKSVESFFQICVIREQKVFLQSSRKRLLTAIFYSDLAAPVRMAASFT